MDIGSVAKEQLIFDCESSGQIFGLGHAVKKEILTSYPSTESLVANVDELSEKLSQICRCCLIERSDMKSVYDEQHSVISMMLLLAPVQIAANDGLPPNICEGCIELLTKAVHFKQQILNADMSLRYYVAVGYKRGIELRMLDFEEFTKTMSDNAATKIEKVGESDQMYSMPPEKDNNQSVDCSFLQKTGNSESVIIDCNTVEKLKEKSDEHDNNVEQQEGIKIEIIEQIVGNNENSKEVYLEKEIVMEEDTSKKPKIHSRNLKRKATLANEENNSVQSVIPNTNSISYGNPKCQLSLRYRLRCRKQMFYNENSTDNETSERVYLEEGTKKQLVAEEDINEKPKRRYIRSIKNKLPFDNENDDDSTNSAAGDFTSNTSCPVIYHDFKRQSSLGYDSECRRIEILCSENSKHAFLCKECHLSCKNESDLYIHGSIHVTNGKFVCRKCESEFPDRLKLKRHVSRHLVDKPFKCKICNRIFPKKFELEQHIQVHTDENSKGSFRCEKCDMSFINESELYIHGSIHVTNGEFVCRKCKRQFSDFIKLHKHIRIHFEDKPFKCKVCNRGFPEKIELTRHFQVHTGENSKGSYRCAECDMSFTNESDLYIHGSIHTTNGQFVCRVCEKEFPNCVKLERHVSRHFEDKPFKCKVCNQGYPEMGDLTRHFRVHTGKVRENKDFQGLFRCEDCEMCFSNDSDLYVHGSIHSTNGFAKLKKHVRRHFENEPFKCKVCNRGFLEMRALRRHFRVHIGEHSKGLFRCGDCDMSFTNESDLYIHCSIHVTNGKFICRKCEKKFPDFSTLEKHVSMHFEDQPFICKVCNQGFPEMGALRRHFRMHASRSRQIAIS